MTLTYVHIARSHAIRRHAISRTYSGALSSCLRCSSSTPPLSHFGNRRHPTTSSVYSGLSLCIGIHAHCVLPWTVQTVGAHRACYDATVLIFCSSFRAREYGRVHFRRCASIFSVLLWFFQAHRRVRSSFICVSRSLLYRSAELRYLECGFPVSNRQHEWG